MDSVMNMSALPYPVLSHLIKILPPESVDNISKCNKKLYNLCCSLRKKPIHTVYVLLEPQHHEGILIYLEGWIKIKQFECRFHWNENGGFAFNSTEDVAFQYIAEFLKTRDVYDTVHFAGDFTYFSENGIKTDILKYLVENKIAIKAKNCEITYRHLESLITFLKENEFTKLTICHEDRNDQTAYVNCTPSEVIRTATTVTSFTFDCSELSDDEVDTEETLRRIEDDLADALMEWRKRFEGRLPSDQHLELKRIYFWSSPICHSQPDLAFFEKIAKDTSNTPMTIEFTLYENLSNVAETNALKNGFTKIIDNGIFWFSKGSLQIHFVKWQSNRM